MRRVFLLALLPLSVTELGMLISYGQRTPHPRRVTPQQWEYCAITGMRGEGPPGGTQIILVEVAFFNEERTEIDEIKYEFKDLAWVYVKKAALGKAMSVLGKAGWELVGEGKLMSVEASEAQVLYFKRVRQAVRRDLTNR